MSAFFAGLAVFVAVGFLTRAGIYTSWGGMAIALGLSVFVGALMKALPRPRE